MGRGVGGRVACGIMVGNNSLVAPAAPARGGAAACIEFEYSKF